MEKDYDKIAEMVEFNFDFAEVVSDKIRGEIYIYDKEVEGASDFDLSFSQDGKTIFTSGPNSYSCQMPVTPKDDPHDDITNILFSLVHLLKHTVGEEGILERSKQKIKLSDGKEVLSLIYEEFDENTMYGTVIHNFDRF